jgi:hypothetical protein
MAIPVHFHKSRAEHILDCLNNRKPIEAPPAGWSGQEMLALAGACLFGALSQGPLSWYFKDVRQEHKEHREATWETLQDDLLAGIQWHAEATMRVEDGKYDERFDPTHKAFVGKKADGQLAVHPVEGFR